MKNIGKQILASLLLLVLFISTTGFSVFSSICLMSGEKTTEVMQPAASCCSMPEGKHYLGGTQITKTDCCKNDLTFVKFNFQAPQQQKVNIEISITDSFITNFNTGIFQPEKFLICFDQNLPPPKPGRDILLQTELLRI